jgi:hypothetical protein
LSHEKFVPDYILNATKELIEIFLNSLYLGDGCFKNGKLCNYTTNSKILADHVQLLNLFCGRTATIKKYDNRNSNFNQTKPIYQISVGETHNTPELRKEFKKIKYNGKVYCVSVPNKTIFTRRNGKTLWTGNSYSGQKRINSITGGNKPNLWFNGHLHKALYMEYRNIHFFESGTLESQTDFMAMKGSPAHVGFWLVDIYHNKQGVNQVRSSWFPYY